MKFIVTILTLVSAVIATPLADQGYIKSVTYSGEGCPAGTASITYPADRSAFSASFSKYGITLGQEGFVYPEYIQRKYCTLVVNVNTPATKSYRLNGIQVFGGLDLSAGATSGVDVSFYYPSSSLAFNPRFFPGPIKGFSEYYTTLDDTPGWSTCGDTRPLSIELQAVVRNFTATATDASNVHVKGVDKFTIEWKDCTPPPPPPPAASSE